MNEKEMDPLDRWFGAMDGLRRRDRGEMPELADGARLEIVCSAKSGTVGSNPTLSAIRFGMEDRWMNPQ